MTLQHSFVLEIRDVSRTAVVTGQTLDKGLSCYYVHMHTPFSLPPQSGHTTTVVCRHPVLVWPARSVVFRAAAGIVAAPEPSPAPRGLRVAHRPPDHEARRPRPRPTQGPERHRPAGPGAGCFHVQRFKFALHTIFHANGKHYLVFSNDLSYCSLLY